MLEEDRDAILEIKNNLVKQLEATAKWQKNKYITYEGKRNSPSLDFSLDKRLDSRIPAQVDWARTAVDHIRYQLDFDVIKNDQWRINQMFEESNVDSAINSAIKTSLIGACSFVSATKGDTSIGEPRVVYTPYSGKEATGTPNDRTGKLDAGLIVHRYNSSSIPTAYRIFLPSGIYEVSGKDVENPDKPVDGQQVELVEEGDGTVKLVDFVYQKDTADRPFGEARVTSAAEVNLDDAQRTLRRMWLSSENFANPQRYMAIRAAAQDAKTAMPPEVTKELINIGSFLRFEGVAEEVKFGQFEANSPANLISVLNQSATLFASSVFMEPSEFGVEAVNGSQSAESIKERKRKMSTLLSNTQKSYGRSIKELARLGLLIRDKKVDEQFGDCQVRWLTSVDTGDLVGIGDAVIKTAEAAPELKTEEFVYDLFGMSMRGRDKPINNVRLPRTPLTEVKRQLSLRETADNVNEASNDPKNNPGSGTK